MKVNKSISLEKTFDISNFEVSIDYLHGTLPMCNVYEFFTRLEEIDSEFMLGNFQLWYSGLHNYATRFCWYGAPLFNVCWNQDKSHDYFKELLIPCLEEKMDIPVTFQAIPNNSNIATNHGIFIKISGQGLMHIAEKPGRLEKLLTFLYDNGFNPTRIDYALDCFDKENPYVPMIIDAFENAIIRKPSHFTIASIMRRNNENIQLRCLKDTYRKGVQDVVNVTFGNHGSSYGMFRCYDKWLQLKESKDVCFEDLLKQKCGVNDYWRRMEIELHGARAKDSFKNFMSGNVSLIQAWALAVDGMFKIKISRSVTYKNNTTGTATRSCLPSELWDSLLNLCKTSDISQRDLYKSPKVKRSDTVIENNIRRNANSLSTTMGHIFSSEENENRFAHVLNQSLMFNLAFRRLFIEKVGPMVDRYRQCG